MALLEDKNPSGIIPVGYYVLVELEKKEKISKGGIVIPDKQVQIEQWGKSTALIVACGPKAFGDAEPQDLDGELRTLRVGDYVWINGQTVYRIVWQPKPDSDSYYVLITDQDVLAYVSKKNIQAENFCLNQNPD